MRNQEVWVPELGQELNDDMKTLVRPILHTSILDMLASGLQAYCLMVAWWLLHFQTSLVYTTAVTSKMEGS